MLAARGARRAEYGARGVRRGTHRQEGVRQNVRAQEEQQRVTQRGCVAFNTHLIVGVRLFWSQRAGSRAGRAAASRAARMRRRAGTGARTPRPAQPPAEVARRAATHCRGAAAALCPLPTAGGALAKAARHRPAHTRAQFLPPPTERKPTHWVPGRFQALQTPHLNWTASLSPASVNLSRKCLRERGGGSAYNECLYYTLSRDDPRHQLGLSVAARRSPTAAK